MVSPDCKVIYGVPLGLRRAVRSRVADLTAGDIRQGKERREKGLRRSIDSRHRVGINGGTSDLGCRERSFHSVLTHDCSLRGRRPPWRDPARRTRGDRVKRAQAFRFAQSFKIAEDESLVLSDRASRGHTELIAPELRNGRPVESVARIEDAVAQILISASVKLIGSRPRDGADDPTGRPS